ncbi:MAG: hypothetical protein WDZ68_01655, partial [Candidatus Paceibacterota bacterium]
MVSYSMKQSFNKLPLYVLWGIAGILFGLAFLHAWLWWFAIIGAVLFIHAIVTSPNIKTVIWGSLFVGTCKAAGAIAWFWSTYPLVSLGIESPFLQLTLIGFNWLYGSVAIGIGMIFCGVLTYILVQKDRRLFLLFPFIFLISEVLGSAFFSLFTLGPGSSININFSFGYIGELLGTVRILYPLAIYGGVYALSFFGALLALGFYVFFNNPMVYKKKTFYFITGILGLILLYAHINILLQTPQNLEKEIIVIETRFDARMFTDAIGYEVKRAEVESAVTTALFYDVDMIVLPEDSRFTNAFPSSKEAMEFISNNAKSIGVILVDSARTTDERGEIVLRAYIYDTKRGEVYTVDKQYLVPHGEYIPYFVSIPLKIFNQEALLADRERNQNYQPGLLQAYNEIPEDIPSVLFCFESTVPFGVYKIKRTEAVPFIVHPVSHSWFNNASQLKRQLASMVRIQAVWNNVTILQAGNIASSPMYFPNGSMSYGEKLLSESNWT